MNNQSGNVLFLILLAVALFAALSYAVTSANRGGSSSVSKDKAKVNAAAIVQYMTSLKNSFMRMKVSNGCTDNQFDFYNQIWVDKSNVLTTTSNLNAPADKRCHVFDGNGGGMVPMVSSNESLAQTYGGNLKAGHGNVRVGQITGVGTSDVGGTESANDIFLVVNGLNRETCLAINEQLGINNPSGEPPQLTSFSGSTAKYVNGSLASTLIFTYPDVGEPALCSWDPVNNIHGLLQVLVAR